MSTRSTMPNLEIHKHFSRFGLGQTVYIKAAPVDDTKPVPGIIVGITFSGGAPNYEVQWPNGSLSDISEVALTPEAPNA